jgi:nanoRNase/pAp phosphatase (c-di-AMP/oligoRNAs hydrolase)
MVIEKDTEDYYKYQKVKEEYNYAAKNINKYKVHPQAIYHSRLINTKQITQQLEKLKLNEEYHTKSLEELTLDNFNLDELSISEDPQEQSSTQAQIQIPPKQ